MTQVSDNKSVMLSDVPTGSESSTTANAKSKVAVLNPDNKTARQKTEEEEEAVAQATPLPAPGLVLGVGALDDLSLGDALSGLSPSLPYPALQHPRSRLVPQSQQNESRYMINTNLFSVSAR